MGKTNPNIGSPVEYNPTCGLASTKRSTAMSRIRLHEHSYGSSLTRILFYERDFNHAACYLAVDPNFRRHYRAPLSSFSTSDPKLFAIAIDNRGRPTDMATHSKSDALGRKMSTFTTATWSILKRLTAVPP